MIVIDIAGSQEGCRTKRIIPLDKIESVYVQEQKDYSRLFIELAGGTPEEPNGFEYSTTELGKEDFARLVHTVTQAMSRGKTATVFTTKSKGA